MDKSKRRLLFVDDDPLAIRGYKRSVDAYTDDWDTYFTSSSREALDILARQPIDVLITDMRMPVIDGNALLEIVSQNYPGVVRFMLSGNVEEAKALHTARLAHQLIAKPCNLSKLREIVERSCRLRDMLSNPKLIRMVTGIKKIPSLPSLYVKLMKELQSDDPTPKIVGDIIAQDVAMTAKILQLVNSAFFGLPNEVVNPQRAVAILGLNTIKALVLSIHIFSEFRPLQSQYFSIDALWRHSLIVGDLSKSICLAAGLDQKAQGEAQVAGVLHDVGKLLQLNVPAFFRSVKISNGRVQLASEYEAFGTSHAEIGAYLLGLWGLPHPVVEAVAYHHFPANLASTEFGIVSALHIANGLYHTVTRQAGVEAYLDIAYLQKCQQTDRLNDWLDLAQKAISAGS